MGIDTANLGAGERSKLLGTSRLPAATDPVAEMGIVRGLTGEPEDLGPTILPELGSVRGYRVAPDPRKVIRDPQPDMRRRFQRLVATALPVDVWLDGSGFLRRIRYTLEEKRLVSGPGVGVTADFSGFGQPVRSGGPASCFPRRIRHTLEEKRLVSGPGVGVPAVFSVFAQPVRIVVPPAGKV